MREPQKSAAFGGICVAGSSSSRNEDTKLDTNRLAFAPWPRDLGAPMRGLGSSRSRLGRRSQTDQRGQLSVEIGGSVGSSSGLFLGSPISVNPHDRGANICADIDSGTLDLSATAI